MDYGKNNYSIWDVNTQVPLGEIVPVEETKSIGMTGARKNVWKMHHRGVSPASVNMYILSFSP